MTLTCTQKEDRYTLSFHEDGKLVREVTSKAEDLAYVIKLGVDSLKKPAPDSPFPAIHLN